MGWGCYTLAPQPWPPIEIGYDSTAVRFADAIAATESGDQDVDLRDDQLLFV